MSLPRSAFRPRPQRFLRGTPYGTGSTPVLYRVDPATDRVAGGSNVTIYGLNFRRQADGTNPLVTFGGELVTVNLVVVDANTITCDTPAHAAGIVDVTITIDGQSFTLANAFTYYETVITRVTPGNSRLNGGARVNVEGFNFVTGMTIKFGGTDGVNPVYIDDRTYSVEVPSHAVGFVDVTAYLGPTLYATLRNGFQYTSLVRGEDIRRTPGITIRDVLNNAPNSCSFRIDGQSKMPEPGEKVEILDSQDSNRKLFAGTIQRVEQIYEELTDQLAWNVSCVDFTWLMNRRRPFGSWRNTSVSQIVKELVAKYAPGFTTNYVQTNLAKVSVTLDGSKDMSTVLSELAQAIGGGHWYVDYDQDVHFFHIVPAGLVLPPSQQVALGANMTVAEGGLIPSTFSYEEGFYVFRHTFVYSDGSESRFGALSNMLKLAGNRNLAITGLPLGVDPAPLTVVARRIYYTAIVKSRSRRSSLETITGIWQVNDNTTTAFNTLFEGGLTNTDVGAVVTAISPIKTYTAAPGSFTPADPTTASYVLLSDQAADVALSQVLALGIYAEAGGTFEDRGWASYDSSGVLYTNGTQPNPRAAGDVYYASADVAAELEAYTDSKLTQLPLVSFSGHLPAPETEVTLTAHVDFNVSYFYALWMQAKVAFLYRDGSVSFPSAGSNIDGLQRATKGYAVKGASFSNIPIGPTVNGVDVVARIIYLGYGRPSEPSYSVNGLIQIGQEVDPPMEDPDWSESGGMAYLVPDNSTVVVSRTDWNFIGYGSDRPYFSGTSINNPDPIPVWPNPDGPFLEDADPPDDIDDANTSLLRDPAFVSDIDISQVRNRIYVIGSGSTTTATANAGATSALVADITQFSPGGGKVRIEDAGNGRQQILDYVGLSGIVGATSIEFAQALQFPVTQGSKVSNFYQADDIESQRAMAKIELDKNGRKTDGIHEYTVVDSSLRAFFQLYMRGQAELELWSRPIVTINYATRDPKSRSGQTVHVDLTNPPCQGDFLIQDVTIDQIHDDSDELMPRYNVRASSVRFDLEDLLLQLMGNRIGGDSTAGLVVSSVSSSIEFVSDSSIITAQLTLTDEQMKAGGTYTIVPGQEGVQYVGISAAWHCYILVAGSVGVNLTIRQQVSTGSPQSLGSGTAITPGLNDRFRNTNVGAVTAYSLQSTQDFRGRSVEVALSAAAHSSYQSSYGFIVVFTYMAFTYPVTS